MLLNGGKKEQNLFRILLACCFRLRQMQISYVMPFSWILNIRDLQKNNCWGVCFWLKKWFIDYLIVINWIMNGHVSLHRDGHRHEDGGRHHDGLTWGGVNSIIKGLITDSIVHVFWPSQLLLFHSVVKIVFFNLLCKQPIQKLTYFSDSPSKFQWW